ncbi:hypothetical protein SAMN05660649_03026 [Desulfotomaculum arcticum]|uniref:Uncharacterized protein n=1 Tax=Desulfotruncus arcticus DSM 17038 TaxID=1121424 RepID=A0A1I2VHM7_9FIRM|nr:hypothetical protein [Desulfotruncus arcticus]SFG88814.1 hypothetical protein SAMN05660649_03026 [Desulfotomaculum arcticum] [Desulfotruncus arcticus DSM 17038]
MAAVNYLQSVAEKMVSSCEARQKDMYERKRYVAGLLGQISKDRAEMAQDMWKSLYETRHNRQVKVNKMLKELTQIRMESWESWAKAVHTMNMIRAGKI